MLDLNSFSDLKVNESVSDTLDSCIVNLYNDTQINYEKYETAVLNGKTWLVLNINYKVDNLGVYHEITLIEPTKQLENYIIYGCAFTDYADITEEIEHALYKFKCPFTIDENVFAEFGGVESIDLRYNGLVNLREVLDDLFSAVDCSVRMYTADVVSFEDNNTTGNLIDINNKSELIDSIDAEYDVDGLVGNADNVYGDNDITEILLPRSAEGLYKNDDGKFYTQYNINKISEFNVVVWYELKNATQNGNPYFKEGQIVLDFLPFLFEKSEYELLDDTRYDTSLPNTQKASFYYTFKGREISNLLKLYSYDAGRTGTTYERICKFFSTNQVIGTTNYYKIAEALIKQDLPSDVVLDPVNGFTINTADHQYLDNVLIKYKPIYNTILTANKRLGDLRTLQNVNAERVNIDLFGKNLRNTADKMGNRELTINTIHNNIYELYDLHDYTADNFIIDARNYAIKNGYVVAQYHLTKNFNIRGKNIRLNRERRIFNIPDENIERIFEHNEVIVLTDKKPEILNAGKSNFINAMDKNVAFKNIAVNDKIHLYDFNLPVIANSSDNGLSFIAKCLDNYAVAYRVEDGVVKPYPYVDSSGNYFDHEIQLYDDFTNGFKLTRASIELLPQTNDLNYKNKLPYVFRDTNVFKDKYEQMSYSFSWQIISESKQIKVGNGFYKMHPFLTGELDILWINGIDHWSENDKPINLNHTNITSLFANTDGTLDISNLGFIDKPYAEIIDNDNNLVLRVLTNLQIYYK